ncbi:MAG: hypothetical protein P1U68_15965 [Verrucomicrobiales bacterium]|nr:hypothetical protein [Verrucomicrobiales bacterium]
MKTFYSNSLTRVFPLAAAIVAIGSFGILSDSYAAAPPEKDREAILAMAGEYEIIFNFEEKVALQPDYKLKEAYQETATEMVLVLKDTPEQIILQHILSVGSGKRIVKHWKQVWTWEDTRLVEFQGREKWEVRDLDPAEVEGAWTQLVTQVDDSPRYESYGKWQHDGGYSRWQSGVTARPLPRREHTKRDDYQILQGVNRHTITPHGWVHEQDNVKQVIDEAGEPVAYIAVEHGVNYYDKTEAEDFTKAREYWEKTNEFWGTVSRFWEEIEAKESGFSIAKEVEGESLMSEMFAIAKTLVEDDESAPSEGDVSSVIEKFLN